MPTMRWVVVWSKWSKVMMSPRRSLSALTGSSITSEPLWIVGPLAPPGTTKGAMPRARIAANRTEDAESTARDPGAVGLIGACIISGVLYFFQLGGGAV